MATRKSSRPEFKPNTGPAPAVPPAVPPPAPVAVEPAAPVAAAAPTPSALAALATPRAETYIADERTVDPSTMTVQGQMDGIIDKNSPLMQRAAAKANMEMAGRGLINSSMAVGAGQTAVLDAAMPMATQDAKTYFEQQGLNQQSQNEQRKFNAGEQNKFGLQSHQGVIQGELDQAKFGHERGMQDDQQGWQSGENNTQRSWQSGENKADRATQKSIAAGNNATTISATGMEIAGAASRQVTQIEADKVMLGLQADADIKKMAAGQEFDLVKMAKANEFDKANMTEAQRLDIQKMEIQNAADLVKLVESGKIDATTRERLLVLDNQYALERAKNIGQMDNDTKKELLAIELEYKGKAMGTTVASQAMLNFQIGAADIMKDPVMTPELKKEQVNALLERTRDTITRLGAINGTNLTDVFPAPTPVDPAAPTPTPTPTTTTPVTTQPYVAPTVSNPSSEAGP